MTDCCCGLWLCGLWILDLLLVVVVVWLWFFSLTDQVRVPGTVLLYTIKKLGYGERRKEKGVINRKQRVINYYCLPHRQMMIN